MRYRIVLASGHVHMGDDERSTVDIVESIGSVLSDDGLPRGWCWVAGLYARRDSIVAVAIGDGTGPGEL